MARIALGCLAMIALAAAAAWGAMELLDHFGMLLNDEHRIVVGVAAIVVVFALGGLWNALIGQTDVRLVRIARGRERPRDGRRVAVLGTIHAVESALTAPFSDRRCVAYEYSIKDPSSPGESQTSGGSYWSGIHMAASEIRSQWGNVRLMGYPEMEGFVEETFRDAEKARRFLEETEFQTGESKTAMTSVASEIFDVYMDQDGIVSKDFRLREAETLEGLVFEEKVVPEGEQVCAIGLYDGSRNSLVPSSLTASTRLRLIAGTPESVESKVSASVGCSVMICLLLGIAGTVVALGPIAPSPILDHVPLAGEKIYELRRERVEELRSLGDEERAERLEHLGVGEE